MSGFVRVGKKTDFPEDTGTGVQVNGRGVCVARQGEKFFAFDDKCTHAESLLSGGEVEEGEIACPLHGARFAIATGEAMTLPAVKPVRTHEVKVEGNDVLVKLSNSSPD